MTLHIEGIIGIDFTPAGLRQALAQTPVSQPTTLRVFLASPGGCADDGLAIYASLIHWKQAIPGRFIRVHLAGTVASIASVIAMAGDEIIAGDHSLMMIHLAWCDASGNRFAFAHAAEALSRYDETITHIYARRTGLPPATLHDLMQAETWLTATQMLALGFATHHLYPPNPLPHHPTPNISSMNPTFNTLLAQFRQKLDPTRKLTSPHDVQLADGTPARIRQSSAQPASGDVIVLCLDGKEVPPAPGIVSLQNGTRLEIGKHGLILNAMEPEAARLEQLHAAVLELAALLEQWQQQLAEEQAENRLQLDAVNRQLLSLGVQPPDARHDNARPAEKTEPNAGAAIVRQIIHSLSPAQQRLAQV